DIYNESDTAERINWHGQHEFPWQAPLIPPGAVQRVELTPQHSGLYFYHSDLIASTCLDSGLYSGLVGGLLVEPPERSEPGGLEHQPVSVAVLKDHEPFLQRTARGYEVSYNSLSINGRLARDAIPPRAESALLHVLNASATEPYSLELPGRAFTVLALDGNEVPRPATVTRLYLGPGERVAARVVADPCWPERGWVIRNSVAEPWDYTRFGSGTS